MRALLRRAGVAALLPLGACAGTTAMKTGTLPFSAPDEPPATSVMTTGGSGDSNGRAWAFFANEGTNTANWTALNGGWSKQPIDGLSTVTNVGTGWWAGTGEQWSPAPHAHMLNIEYGTPGSGGWPGSTDLGQAALGAYDATWLSWLEADAAAAKVQGSPITVVRIWQEINGNWMPCSTNQTGRTSVDGTAPGTSWPAATIIKAWDHMAEQVRLALPDAKIEWNLNVGGPWRGPTSPGNGTGFDLYPGDQYVDIIGVDAYEKSVSWANTVSGPGVNLNQVVAFATAHNKLVGISETAAHNGDASYLMSMANYFDSLGMRAAYIVYYDQGSAANGDNIIYSTTGTDSAGTALQDALNASSFGTKPYVGNLSRFTNRNLRQEHSPMP